jgi:ribonucleotide monophosphatase NagD (HAD superfamily)
MVGDYPQIDIKGGKTNGMQTALVESGIFNSKDTDNIERYHKEYLYYADHIVPNILNAVDVILEENGI